MSQSAAGDPSAGLSVHYDLSRGYSRTASLPASGINNNRRRRKRTLAAPRGLSKEEYFSRLEHF